MPAVSDYKFLERACKLQLYGVRLHSALDVRGVPILVGANHDGVHIYEEDDVGLRRLNRLAWPRIMRIHYQSKRLCIEVRGDGASSRNVDVIFHLQTARVTKRTWCMLVEKHIFYRLKTPREKDSTQLSRSQVNITHNHNRVSSASPEWKSSSFGLWALSAKSVSSLQSLVSPKSSKVIYGGKTLYESRQRSFSRRSGHRYWDADKHSQCAAFQSAPCLLPLVERRPSTRPLPPLPTGVNVNSNRNSASVPCNDDPNYAVIGVDLTAAAKANGFNDAIGAYQVTAICRKESQYSTINKYRDRRTQGRNAFAPARKHESNSDSDSDSDTDRIHLRQPSRETNIDDVDAIPYDF